MGAIDILRTTYFNKSSQFVNGFDFDLTYRFPALAIGNFTFSSTWTKLIDFHAYNLAARRPAHRHALDQQRHRGRRDPHLARQQCAQLAP